METTMSFARAFSTRRKVADTEINTPAFLGRAASKRGGRPIVRTQISSPIALVATSNGQVNYARSIVGTQPIEIRHVSSGSSSSSSSEDSDTSMQSSGTITDASSIDESPMSAEPEPNHLTSYFKPAVDTHTRSLSRSLSLNDSARPSLDSSPKIPERAPSHSKKAHEGLHRKRSIQRMLSPPPSRGREIVRDSLDMFSPTRSPFVEAPKDSPFGKELAQLQEVAEEFGHVVRDVEAEADAAHMQSRGLAHFNASDYMFEIQSLIHTMFVEEHVAVKDFGNFF